jgi:hypothetical protein
MGWLWVTHLQNTILSIHQLEKQEVPRASIHNVSRSVTCACLWPTNVMDAMLVNVSGEIIVNKVVDITTT